MEIVNYKGSYQLIGNFFYFYIMYLIKNIYFYIKLLWSQDIYIFILSYDF